MNNHGKELQWEKQFRSGIVYFSPNNTMMRRTHKN